MTTPSDSVKEIKIAVVPATSAPEKDASKGITNPRYYRFKQTSEPNFKGNKFTPKPPAKLPVQMAAAWRVIDDQKKQITKLQRDASAQGKKVAALEAKIDLLTGMFTELSNRHLPQRTFLPAIKNKDSNGFFVQRSSSVEVGSS